MSIRSRIQSSLIAIGRRSQMEGEMDAELLFHLEAYAEDLVRSGVPRAEAMRRAHIEFGGVERVKEECREVRGVGFLETLWMDTWYGVRTLRKSPGFTFIAVFVIVLCIGAATTLFTVVQSVLLRPLPFADPSQLVMLYEHFRDPALNAQGFSYVSVAPA